MVQVVCLDRLTPTAILSSPFLWAISLALVSGHCSLLVLLPPSDAVFLLSFTGLYLFSQNETLSGSGKCSATSSWKTSPG